MKKALLTILLLLFLVPVFSQKRHKYLESGLPIDSSSTLITFKDVVSDPGSKSKIFSSVLKWYTINHSKNTIDIKDLEEGRLYAKGYFKGNKTYYGGTDWSFHLEVIARDGKYRYEITNIYNESKRMTLESLLDSSIMGRERFIQVVKEDFTWYINALKNTVAKESEDKF